jgi:uncharacterized protein YbjT (DUF2867 family)
MSPIATRILILGGYGTFGGHLATLLAGDARVSLLIAGRSLSQAQAFIGLIVNYRGWLELRHFVN